MTTQSPVKDPRILVYTDGSCLSNPGGLSGAGVYIEFPDGQTAEGSFGYSTGTNQRAELLAVFHALDHLSTLGRLDAPEGICIRSDSLYAVDGLRKHLSDRDGRLPTANRDLWLRILPLARRAGDQLTIEWVKGHNGDPGNEKADQLAGDAAQFGPWEEDFREIPGIMDLFA
jgi:ribonuclease HI